MPKLAEIISGSNFSIVELSRRSGILEDRLKKIISGEPPYISELRVLSSTLNIPFATLVEPPGGLYSDIFLFRGQDDQEKKHLDLEVISHTINNFMGVIDCEEVSWDWLKRFTYTSETHDEAERLAGVFRSIFFADDYVEPLSDLASLLDEQLSFCVYVLPDMKSDGASAIIKRIPFIFIAPRFQPRMLFTLAHELGHVIAHHKPDEDFILNEAFDDFQRPTSRKRSERFVDAFASSLLLPAPGVGKFLKYVREEYQINSKYLSDIEILLLARYYSVSFEVAARRCENLSLLPRGGAYALNARLRSEHGSPEGRASELNLPDRRRVNFPYQPSLAIRGVVRKIRDGEISIGRAAELLNISQEDLLQASVLS